MSLTPLPGRSTPDVRAAVRALDALTTQVKRLANHTANPATFARETAVADDRDTPTTGDDGPRCEHDGPHPGFTCAEVDQTRLFWEAQWARDTPTAPATTCSARYTGPDNPWTECIRAAQHEHPFHTDERGWNWRDDVAVYPIADGALKQAPAADEERCITHWHGACDGTTRDCAFPTPGTGRRRKLRVLLNRLNNGIPLTPDEAQALTRHVATEICDANDGHKEARRLGERLRKAREETALELGRDLLRDGLDAFLLRLVGPDNAARLLGELSERAELEQAQAAIERVRRLVVQTAQAAHVGTDDHTIGRYDMAVAVLEALDGAEQPTTETAPKLPRLGTTEGT